MLGKLAMTGFVGGGHLIIASWEGFGDFLNLKKNSSFWHFHLLEMVLEDGIYAYSGREFKVYLSWTGYCNSYWVITHKNLDFQHCPRELLGGALGCKKKKK